jgi:hypothetical protein
LEKEIIALFLKSGNDPLQEFAPQPGVEINVNYSNKKVSKEGI